MTPSAAEVLLLAAVLAVAGFPIGWGAALLGNWLSKRGLTRRPQIEPLTYAVVVSAVGAFWGAGLALLPVFRPFFRRLLGL
jgi:hypothetical protein